MLLLGRRWAGWLREPCIGLAPPGRPNLPRLRRAAAGRPRSARGPSQPAGIGGRCEAARELDAADCQSGQPSSAMDEVERVGEGHTPGPCAPQQLAGGPVHECVANGGHGVGSPTLAVRKEKPAASASWLITQVGAGRRGCWRSGPRPSRGRAAGLARSVPSPPPCSSGCRAQVATTASASTLQSATTSKRPLVASLCGFVSMIASGRDLSSLAQRRCTPSSYRHADCDMTPVDGAVDARERRARCAPLGRVWCSVG